jgi:hypothetical protein
MFFQTLINEEYMTNKVKRQLESMSKERGKTTVKVLEVMSTSLIKGVISTSIKTSTSNNKLYIPNFLNKLMSTNLI